jgi:iron complex transport system substrate-binding protein
MSLSQEITRTIVLLSMLCWPSMGLLADQQSSAKANPDCARLISLAPSITETVFALGLAPKLGAVSRFCDLPVEYKNLPRVGGFLDPEIEQIARLKPSIVLLLSEFRDWEQSIGRLGIKTLVLEQRSVDGIDSSIEQIGSICNAESKASELTSRLKREKAEIQKKVERFGKIRTLIVVGGSKVGSLGELYISGRDGFYNQLLDIAGGVNVFAGETRASAALSLEQVVRMKPEVILGIYPDNPDPDKATADSKELWSRFPSIPAVRSGRVHALTSKAAFIPGPRYVELLRTMATLLHPEEFNRE